MAPQEDMVNEEEDRALPSTTSKQSTLNSLDTGHWVIPGAA